VRKPLLPIIITIFASLVPLSASAHVVVGPAQVGVGALQAFSVGVPNERDSATVALRLVIPGGLASVRPNVKPGWTIAMAKTGSGDDARVTEITWTGGQIPPDQRDEFALSAQAPAQPTSLTWKAYQTYADGTVVSWDQAPDGKGDEHIKPYSVTKVIDDLATGPTTPATSAAMAQTALVIASLALLVAAAGFVRRRR